jgi:acetyl esterase/lipase
MRTSHSGGFLGALTLSLCILLTACNSGTGAGPTAGASALSSTSVRDAVKAGDPPAPRLAAGQKATVTYCNHQQAQITEPPVLHGPTPAVVYVHGGGWVSGNFDSGGFLIGTIGPSLAARGFVVVSLNYRLGPHAQWPDQIEDVKCAVRYLRANAQRLHVYPSEIGAWGESAGGHLVSLLASAGPAAGWDVGPYPGVSSRVESVVDMAGPSDLLTMGDQGDAVLVAQEFRRLLGAVATPDLDAQLKADSPVTYVKAGDPPFLIVQSTNDTVVYPQQALELAWDLAANGVPHRIVMVRGGGHSFDDPGASLTETQITNLIVKYFLQTLVFHSTTGLADASSPR